MQQPHTNNRHSLSLNRRSSYTFFWVNMTVGGMLASGAAAVDCCTFIVCNVFWHYDYDAHYDSETSEVETSSVLALFVLLVLCVSK